MSLELLKKSLIVAALLLGGSIVHAQHSHLNVGVVEGDTKLGFKNGVAFAYDFVASSGYVGEMSETAQGNAAAYYGGTALTYAVTPSALPGTNRQASSINSNTGAVTYRAPEPFTETSSGPAGVGGANTGSFIRLQLVSIELLSGTATSFSFWGALVAYPAPSGSNPSAEWNFGGVGAGTLTSATGTDCMDLTAINTRIGDGTTTTFPESNAIPSYPNPFSTAQDTAGFRWNVPPAGDTGDAVDPYGHIHGRSWSTNAPGDFKLTWQAFDENGIHPDSDLLQVKLSARFAATIQLDGLAAAYDGSPKPVSATPSVTATPVITYDGSATAPTDPGTYAVVAKVETSTHRGSATGNLIIGKGSQVITFPPPINTPVARDTITLAAVSSVSGFDVEYSLISGNATLNGGQLTLNDGGAVVIRASSPGDSFYEAADPVDLTVDPGLRSQSITFSGVKSKHFLSQSPLQLRVSSTSGGSVGISASGKAKLIGSKLILTGPGRASITASQPGDGVWAAASRTHTIVIEDNEPPEVRSKATIQSISDSTSFSCQVSDDDVVEKVAYEVKRPSEDRFGRRTKVTPRKSGTAFIRLQTKEPGSYTVKIHAVDASGNRSRSKLVTIIRN